MNEDGRIYHEKQLSSLCGQHTLNNLLGAPLYTADTLASIALEMDERERGIMASEGLDTRDMAKFLVSLVRQTHTNAQVVGIYIYTYNIYVYI